MQQLERVIRGKEFYFSEEYELTNSLQDNLLNGMKVGGNWRKEYFWNHWAMRDLVGYEWVVTTVVGGLVQQHQLLLGNT